MVVSKEFLQKITRIFSPDSFQAPFARRVAQWCIAHFEKYQKAIGREIEDVYMKEKTLISEEEATLLEDFLASISDEYERSEEFNVDFHFDKARDYFSLTDLKHLEDKIHQAVATGRPEDSGAAIEWYKSTLARINAAQDEEQKGFTAKELENMKIPKPKWIIENVLPEGLSIMGGKPKKGKSLLVLNMLLSVTSGIPTLGNTPSKTGTAIYLALEDTKGRLQDRIRRILKGKPFPEQLILFPQRSFPRMPEGLIMLEEEIKKCSPRLIAIDTWGRFKPPSKSKRNDSTGGYDIGVEEISQIKDLGDRYGADLLIVHHMKKGGSEDIIESFLGTIANVATADNSLGLVRMGQNPDATIHIEGRDIEAQDIAIKLDSASLTWESMGPAAEVQSTGHRQAIVDAILNNEGPMTPKAIAQATGLKSDYVTVTVREMARQGSLTKIERGKYDAPVDERSRWRMNREKVVPMRRRRGN